MITIISYVVVAVAFTFIGIAIGQEISPTVHKAITAIDYAENSAKSTLAKITSHKAS